MHLNHGQLSPAYLRHLRRQRIAILILCTGLVGGIFFSLSLGAADIPLLSVTKTLLGLDSNATYSHIIRQIRLPQALAAVSAGAGLAIAGAVMQSILRNPLGSPFTLGISHGAAFGAALGVMLLGRTEPTALPEGIFTLLPSFLTTSLAFVFSLSAAAVIIAVSRLRGTTPETMILTGVGLGALFTAGTMFLQFFADDVQLAAMVFWTFGDTTRASWPGIALIAGATLLATVYFIANSWNYNIIDIGDEAAKGLGVRVDRLRLITMFLATLLTAIIVSLLGIIGFVGLVVPHLIRSLIGADHRFLLPATLVGGGLLLLISDTAARLLLAPHVLPVSILTAFMGAPLLLYLIIRKKSC